MKLYAANTKLCFKPHFLFVLCIWHIIKIQRPDLTNEEKLIFRIEYCRQISCNHQDLTLDGFFSKQNTVQTVNIFGILTSCLSKAKNNRGQYFSIIIKEEEVWTMLKKYLRMLFRYQKKVFSCNYQSGQSSCNYFFEL